MKSDKSEFEFGLKLNRNSIETIQSKELVSEKSKCQKKVGLSIVTFNSFLKVPKETGLRNSARYLKSLSIKRELLSKRLNCVSYDVRTKMLSS